MKQKQVVMDSAVQLFTSQGYDATTTSASTGAAGVTEPVIHYHSESKDGLFSHTPKSAFDSHFQIIDEMPDEVRTIENITQADAALSSSAWNNIPAEIGA